MLCYTAALFILVNATKQLLKRKNVPRNINRFLTISASFVLSFSMMGVLTFNMTDISRSG